MKSKSTADDCCTEVLVTCFRRQRSLFKRCSKLTPCVSAWLTIIASTIVYFVLVFPSLTQLSVYLHFVHILLIISSGVNFLIATFTNPGFYAKATLDEYDYDDIRSPLYRSVEISDVLIRLKWCSTCQFYRPPRCSHCSSCDACVENFDHHCPWINNCVGRRNYRFFFCFLFSTLSHMIISFGCCIFLILNNFRRLRHEITIA